MGRGNRDVGAGRLPATAFFGRRTIATVATTVTRPATAGLFVVGRWPLAVAMGVRLEHHFGGGLLGTGRFRRNAD